jgi:hypothetical protein
MRHAITRRALALALPALLAGCGEAPQIYNQEVTVAYSPTEYGQAAGGGELPTVVRGDPFGIGAGRFAEAVVAALARHPPRPQPTTFTLEPGPDARTAYRAVLLFDAPPAAVQSELCARPPAVPVVDPGSRVRVLAAFCRDGRLLTRVTGEIRRADGPDDARFDALLSQVVLALFPLAEPTRD